MNCAPGFWANILEAKGAITHSSVSHAHVLSWASGW